METNETISGTGIVDVIIKDPIPPEPAPGADDKKPIPDATDENAVVDTPEQQEAKKQSKFARRLDRQKFARIAAETELRLTKERLAAYEAKESQGKDTGEPKQEDFTDFTEYQRAVGKYDAAQLLDARLKSEREANQGKERQAQHTEGNAKIAKDWSEREAAFQSANKDYDAVVTPFVEEELQTLLQPVRMAIVESEVGPALLHYLAKNPDVFDRIATFSAVRQIAELGKLEAKLAAPASRKASEAPPPPNPNNGGRSAAKGYSDNMTDTEYKEWRKSNGARWAR